MKKKVFKDIIDIIVSVLLIYIIFWHIIGITVIESESMEPTLMTGNTVIINRLSYKLGKDVQRGDIVIFTSDEFGLQFGKRVIGLPGDVIEFKEKNVIVNNSVLDESEYLGKNIRTVCNKTFTVPDDCYFMLGDNREYSWDSRFWENPYINKEDIIGKYIWQIDFSIKYDIFNSKEVLQ